MDKPLYVIGAPGVGKSTVCNLLSDHIGHLDLSREIDQKDITGYWNDPYRVWQDMRLVLEMAEISEPVLISVGTRCMARDHLRGWELHNWLYTRSDRVVRLDGRAKHSPSNTEHVILRTAKHHIMIPGTNRRAAALQLKERFL